MDVVFALLPSPLLGPAVWAPVADRLVAGGHRVVRPAVPGAAPDAPATVLDRLLASVPQQPEVVLVAHSNAGLYVPSIVARRDNVVASVFVDAGLPPHDGRVALAPPALLDHLRSMTADDGLLPPWTAWFPDPDVDVLFPDAASRAAVEAEQHAVPLACLDATLDVPAGWDDVPGAYLAFGDTYADERARAGDWGWPVTTLAGNHLHMLVAPDDVAATILDLLDQAG